MINWRYIIHEVESWANENQGIITARYGVFGLIALM